MNRNLGDAFLPATVFVETFLLLSAGEEADAFDSGVIPVR